MPLYLVQPVKVYPISEYLVSEAIDSVIRGFTEISSPMSVNSLNCSYLSKTSRYRILQGGGWP